MEEKGPVNDFEDTSVVNSSSENFKNENLEIELKKKNERIKQLEAELKQVRDQISSLSEEKEVQQNKIIQDLHFHKDQLYFSIEAAQLGTWDFDPRTQKLKINERLKNWFGLEAQEEIDLSSAIKKIAEKDQERVLAAIQEVLSSSSNQRYDITYSLAEDENEPERVVRAQGKAWFSEKNEAYRLNGTLEDITERTKTEKQLKESLFRFNEFIYSSPSLIAIFKGQELIIDIANDAILQTWGKDSSIIGKPFLEALPEMEGQGFDKLLLNVYRTGESYQAYEVPAEHIQNGKKVVDYVDFIYQPQRNIYGEIEGVAVIATKVNEKVKLNKQIKKEEQKFREMAELIPDKITNAAPDGSLLYCNKSWMDFTGMTFEELKEGKAGHLTHPDDAVKIAEARKKTFEKGIDLELELRFKNLSGDYIWHLLRGKPIKDEDGNIVSWITSTTEIQKLKEEQRKKEDFLKLVSHELKTPVTSIKGYTQLLLNMFQQEITESDRKRIHPFLTRIDNQINRLSKIILEILDLSRVEKSQLELTKSKFNLNDLVEETIEDLQYLNSSNINILLEQKCDCEVYADKDRIGQVLINFVTNAIKYSSDDNNVEIQIFCPSENKIAVKVKDFGIGIEEKEQNNIFKPFYRVSSANEATYAGFGIGLYLSKEIVEKHGGEINLQSTLGKGSAFCFTLPLNNPVYAGTTKNTDN